MIFYESKEKPLYCWYGNNMTFPPHIHKELELIMVTSGEIEITIDTSVQVLSQGDICIFFPNTIHGYRSIDNSDNLLLIFNGSMLPLYKNIFSTYETSNNYIHASEVPSEVYTSLHSINEELSNKNDTGIITGYLYLVIGRLLPLLNLKKIENNLNVELIERILIYIQQNYMNDITLSSIAQALNISPFYLSKVFSHNIGLRLDKYINELRINYANHLLANSQKQITEIAFECGFDTIRSFNRVYKTITSFTPREFRQQQLR